VFEDGINLERGSKSQFTDPAAWPKHCAVDRCYRKDPFPRPRRIPLQTLRTTHRTFVAAEPEKETGGNPTVTISNVLTNFQDSRTVIEVLDSIIVEYRVRLSFFLRLVGCAAWRAKSEAVRGARADLAAITRKFELLDE
jgi:hypothetical protein